MSLDLDLQARKYLMTHNTLIIRYIFLFVLLFHHDDMFSFVRLLVFILIP